MEIVLDVLSQLESFAITKEGLEVSDRHDDLISPTFVPSPLKATRLGKHINDLRRKATDRYLASRAKNLVKKWRQLLVTNSNATSDQSNHHHPASNGHHTNGTVANAIPSGAAGATTAVSTPSLKPQTMQTNMASLPSSRSTSPGLSSRPTTPAPPNQSRPASPLGMSKTNAANKKLRKRPAGDEVDGSEATPPKVHSNGFGPNPDVLFDGDTRDSIISATSGVSGDNSNSIAFNANSKPKARNQRRSSDRKGQAVDVLEQQMMSVRRASGKVRTTQELVQELAQRSGQLPIIKEGSNGGFDVKETNTELMNRFFDSQANLTPGSDLSPPISNAPSPSSLSEQAPSASKEPSRATTPVQQTRHETVEEVMAKLPIIKASEVLAELEENEEDDDDLEIEGLIPVKKPEKPVLEVTDELVTKLHEEPMEHFNGNYDHKGEFKEWHEVLTKESKDGELLYVLPYSVIE